MANLGTKLRLNETVPDRDHSRSPLNMFMRPLSESLSKLLFASILRLVKEPTLAYDTVRAWLAGLRATSSLPSNELKSKS